jgi:nitroreductase
MSSPKDATTDHPVNELVARRWSPCAFAARDVPDADLRSLFEAARWAPSSFNEQPWRYLVAKKSDLPAFTQALSCLVESNQAWAKTAPVLALACTSLHFARNGKPNAAALHDLGIAAATLTFEATSRGLSVHQMIGILPDRVREVYEVPEEFLPLTGLAIGYVGDPSQLPEKLRERDRAPRVRRPLAETVFGASLGHTSPIVR